MFSSRPMVAVDLQDLYMTLFANSPPHDGSTSFAGSHYSRMGVGVQAQDSNCSEGNL